MFSDKSTRLAVYTRVHRVANKPREEEQRWVFKAKHFGMFSTLALYEIYATCLDVDFRWIHDEQVTYSSVEDVVLYRRASHFTPPITLRKVMNFCYVY